MFARRMYWRRILGPDQKRAKKGQRERRDWDLATSSMWSRIKISCGPSFTLDTTQLQRHCLPPHEFDGGRANAPPQLPGSDWALESQRTILMARECDGRPVVGTAEKRWTQRRRVGQHHIIHAGKKAVFYQQPQQPSYPSAMTAMTSFNMSLVTEEMLSTKDPSATRVCALSEVNGWRGGLNHINHIHLAQITQLPPKSAQEPIRARDPPVPWQHWGWDPSSQRRAPQCQQKAGRRPARP